jgi:hypothetical protein
MRMRIIILQLKFVFLSKQFLGKKNFKIANIGS